MRFAFSKFKKLLKRDNENIFNLMDNKKNKILTLKFIDTKNEKK